VTDVYPSREAPSRLPEPRVAASVATSTNSHLEIDAVTKNFGPQAVLKGVNLSVAKGGTTAIVGPSGSGKTTLLRLIAGFEHPDTGDHVEYESEYPEDLAHALEVIRDAH